MRSNTGLNKNNDTQKHTNSHTGIHPFDLSSGSFVMLLNDKRGQIFDIGGREKET